MSIDSYINFSALPVWMLLILALVGVALLWKGGDWLTDGAASLGLYLKIDPVIVGLTIVAVATSLPELITSMFAALRDSPDVATGNIVGSNLANIGLILGIAGLVWPFSVHSNLVRMEMPILLGATALFCILGFIGGSFDRFDGILLLACMVAYLLFVIRRRAVADKLVEELEENVAEKEHSLGVAILFVLLGGALLAVGSDVLVTSSVDVARRLGISELLIGITLVAVGTSLPELSATIAAGLKRQPEIVAGNIVGSNLFNMILIGGSVSVFKEIPVNRDLFYFEIPVMFVLTALLWRLFSRDCKITRKEGALLLVLYAVIIVTTSLLQTRGA